jgi:anti-sigma regulatory factor (Ser/Thr protein kinase)
MPEPVLELEIPAELAHLEEVAAFLHEGCARLGAPPGVAHAVELAADEAVTNVIRYAYPPGRQGTVRLRLWAAGGELVLAIRDQGRPFREEEAPPPDLESPLEDRPVGGLGIFLMHKMMDRVERRREEGENLLLLAKRLPAEPAA